MISWLALSLGLALIAYGAAWSRIPTKARGLTVAAFALSLPISGITILNARGWPVQTVPYISDIPDGERTVHGVHLIPEVAIYIMLDVGGEPRLFHLPWDAKTADKLQRSMEEGEGKLKARKKGKSEDEEYPLIFYPEPQPAMPEKQPEQPGMTYEREGE